MGSAYIRRSGAVLLSALLFAALLLPTFAAAPRTHSASSAGTLVFYSAQGYDSAMAKAFQKESHITVSLLDSNTGNLLAKIAAERNNPQWDVVWFDGDATMQTLNIRASSTNGPPPTSRTTRRSARSLIPADHAFFPTASPRPASWSTTPASSRGPGAA